MDCHTRSAAFWPRVGFSVLALFVAPSTVWAQSSTDGRLLRVLDNLDKRLAAIERRLDDRGSKETKETEAAKAEVRALKQQIALPPTDRPKSAAPAAAYARASAPPAARWTGPFVALSAGNQWLRTNDSSSQTTQQSTTADGLDGAGVVQNRSIDTNTYGQSGNGRGRDTGIVFTATAGYNFSVFERGLVGWQSEYSKNLTSTTSHGANLYTQVNTDQSIIPVGPVRTTSYSSSNIREGALTNDWTASAMARFGFLATPDTQVYGLVGWSWGGFTQTGRTYTLNGFTYGAGVERDFGWLRGFVQAKATMYQSKTVTSTADASSSQIDFTPGVGGSIATTTGTQVNRYTLGADSVSLTAGVVVPVDFPR
jgi:hypothetical protein